MLLEGQVHSARKFGQLNRASASMALDGRLLQQYVLSDAGRLDSAFQRGRPEPRAP